VQPSADDEPARAGEAETPPAPGADAPRPPAAEERGTSQVELLWDLVFVFAITQVTTLLARDPTWRGFARSMLALALVWWAWSAFVWAANAEEENSPVLRAILLTATVLIFVVGLALPHAFGSDGLLFALAYAAVRLLHLTLYTIAAREGRARWSAILGFAVTVVIGMTLLVAGALVGGVARDVLWVAAFAIDYLGPAWLTRARLRGLQEVAVAHFADRYGDFVVICLGESIVSVGVGVANGGRPLSAGLVVAATLGLLIAVGMWWTYFDRLAEEAQRRLRVHTDPVLAAADSFSYLHLVIVAGIIIFAGGIRLDVEHAIQTPMPQPGRFAFCGGIALYLLGVSAFRLRLLRSHSPGRLVVVVALVVLGLVGAGFPAWLTTAVATLLLAALCVAEVVGGGSRKGVGSKPTTREERKPTCEC
jgi:low temperature requirement protein LtrA